MKLLKLKLVVSILAVITILIGVLGQVALAVSSDQRLIYDYGIRYFNTQACTPGSNNIGNSQASGKQLTIKEWIEKFGKLAYEIGQKLHIPYEAILAQGALESAYGSACPGNNCFGIKADAYYWLKHNLPYRLLATTEHENGANVAINDKFRMYDSLETSFIDHAYFINQNSVYSKCVDSFRIDKSVYNYVECVGKIYATSPSYRESIHQVIKDQARYRQELGFAPSSSSQYVLSSDSEYKTKLEDDSYLNKTKSMNGGSITSGSASSNGDYCDGSLSNNGSIAGNKNVAETAKTMAWDNDNHLDDKKPEFKEAADKLNPTMRGDSYKDCGKFASVVIRHSGVDPNFPVASTWRMMEHMCKNTDKWAQIDYGGDANKLKPGDVLIRHDGFNLSTCTAGDTGSGNGHIMIYIGDGSVAHASLNEFTGKRGGLYGGASFTAYRAKAN